MDAAVGQIWIPSPIPRRAPGVGLLLLLAAGAAAGCQKPPPWVEYGPPRSEEIIQAMAVDLVMELQDQWDSPTPIHAICVGVGRRVWVGLNAAQREERWDPSDFFFRQLGPGRLPAFPLSACTWGEDVEERVRETGARAAAVGVSNVDWRTSRSAAVTVWIRENPQYNHSYLCQFDRSSGQWEPLSCTFRFS